MRKVKFFAIVLAMELIAVGAPVNLGSIAQENIVVQAEKYDSTTEVTAAFTENLTKAATNATTRASETDYESERKTEAVTSTEDQTAATTEATAAVTTEVTTIATTESIATPVLNIKVATIVNRGKSYSVGWTKQSGKTPTDIEWWVFNQNSEATTLKGGINGATLTVGSNETASTLTIAAIVNDEIAGTVDVTVSGNSSNGVNSDSDDDSESSDYSYSNYNAYMSLPMLVNGKLPMKVGQSTSAFKIEGSIVKSITSNKKSVVTVSKVKKNGCTLKAKKRGSAIITVTLKSGYKVSFTVAVQKGTVKTTKIYGTKSITVKRGKTATLSMQSVPFTSQQKLTYKSSNTKIATVNSSGKVTGKKKGTTTITVKSGSKSYKVTVKVK